MGASDEYEIDFDDVAPVTPDNSHSGDLPATYYSLAEPTRSAIIDISTQKYSENVVNAVLGPFWDWKRSSYGNYAKTHERLFKSALDIAAPERNGNLIAVDPTQNQEQFAKQLHQLSVDFISHHVGDEVVVYRGLNYVAAEVFKEILEHPFQDEIRINSLSSLLNFTTDQVIARDYGLLFAKTTIRPDSVAVASDFILKQKQNNEVINADAELRVIGDAVSSLLAENIQYPSSQIAVRDGLKNPNQLAIQDHRRILDILSIASRKDITISGQYAERTLRNWFEYTLQSDHGREIDELITVDTLIGDVLH